MSTARAYATVTGPTATYTSPDGRTEPVAETGNDADIRVAVLRRAAEEARQAGHPVELVTRGDRGEHHLLVHTDGAVTTLPDTPPPPTDPAPSSDIPSGSGEGVATRRSTTAVPAPPGADTGDVPVRRSTFIAEPAPVPVRRTGWRGLLSRTGLTVPPSRIEARRAQDAAVVSRQWAGCRTLAVVNGKGGVGKTMTTAMLAAVYAREGGGNVLAWDNNDTRGTLGWRTEQGLYDTTLRDLLPAANELLAGEAGVSDIARFVHHQSADRYDVLRSNPELLATDQRINTNEFDLLMQVAARYYRLVIFDSGNDESADRWTRMVDGASQLVIPTLTAAESAESAALLLDALRHRDPATAALAEQAVVVVTEAEPGSHRDTARIVDGFTGRVRAVEVIPFDPALKTGPLRFDTLHRHTRDAWTRTAATIATAL